ncbi:MAG: ArnT family glycosyltransferase [Minisyncoccia bacterium]
MIQKIFFLFKKIASQTILTFIIISVLVVAGILMFYSSLQESATMDELAHIPAGYAYLKYGDNRLNPEHPPLLKDLSAIPLLFLKLNFPFQSEYWTKYVNGQWDVGRVFLYESGNDADKIIQLARIFPILLTLLTSFLLYLLAKKFFGPYWALLPFVFFALSPTVLAHGHYVTTDLAATFGTILIFLFVLPKITNPTPKNLIIAGIFLGIAELCKYSLLIFYPLLIFYVLVWEIIQIIKQKKSGIVISPLKEILKTLGNLIIVFLVSFILIYLVYLPQNINYPQSKQISDTKEILTSFAGGPDPELKTCFTWTGSFVRQFRCLAEINILLAQNKILKPFAQYLLGALMVFQRSSAGNTGYFLGMVSAAGWHYYFPVVFLIKEPIPSLIIIFLALFLAIKSFLISGFKNIKNKNWWDALIDWLNKNYFIFTLLIFAIFYWTTSIISPLNIGYRHLMIAFPAILLLSTYQIKKWWGSNFSSQNILMSLLFSFENIKKLALKTLFLFILVIWYIIETLVISPHFIAYFNEFVGGPANGHKYVVDSNLDWGQDLKRLAKFVEKNGIEKIKVDYFGGGSPAYYLKDKYEPYWSAKGEPEPGSWFAVSLSFLQTAQGKPVPGFERKPEDSYSWLKDKKPVARIGYSIFVYKF